MDIKNRVLFSKIARYIPEGQGQDLPNTWITGIALDSRRVQPGDLFVALAGGHTNGHRFIPVAVQQGAAAVVGTEDLTGLPVPYLQVKDGRQALALLSAAFYGFPAHQLTVLGVTGTDGKTTTATLIYKILLEAGLKAGLISTVNAYIGDRALDTGFHVTTPEAPDVQHYLAQMVASGISYVVLEATSHGLVQQRVEACEFDLAVVTNITHEHLDYHKTYEIYRAAKGRLFQYLAETPRKAHGKQRTAVLNRDDSSYDYLKTMIQELNTGKGENLRAYPGIYQDKPVTILDYGLHPEASLSAKDIHLSPTGLSFRAGGSGLDLHIESSLVGEYNVSNCLAALAATVLGLGIDFQAAQKGIRNLEGIPGRMEVIDLGQDFLTLVDFAHTPNALRQALESARQVTKGRVFAVFGSAGLRDRAKRKMMAEISTDLADLTVITAEDPRSEDLEAILAEMAAGAVARGGVEGKTFWRIKDRGEALRFAVAQANPGDLVLVLGKGHEQSMCFGDIEYPWDDRTALRAALSEKLGLPGPRMPYLPTQGN